MPKLQVEMLNTIVELVSDEDTLNQLRRVYGPYVLNKNVVADYVFEIKRLHEDNSVPTWEIPKVDFNSGNISIKNSGFAANINNSTHMSSGEFYPSQIIQSVNHCIIYLLSMHALGKGGLLLHSACIERNERAYFFLGRSGSGKSTVARLSLPARVLNDDVVGILPSEAGWMAYPLPFWHNNQTRPSARTDPVLTAGFYHLIQSKEISTARLYPASGAAKLVSSAALSTISQLAPEVVRVSQTIVHDLPFFNLHFQKNNLFWNCIL